MRLPSPPAPPGPSQEDRPCFQFRGLLPQGQQPLPSEQGFLTFIISFPPPSQLSPSVFYLPQFPRLPSLPLSALVQTLSASRPLALDLLLSPLNYSFSPGVLVPPTVQPGTYWILLKRSFIMFLLVPPVWEGVPYVSGWHWSTGSLGGN